MYYNKLWLVQFGIFLNMLGYGAVLPFEVVYLSRERGFELGVAGLVVGTLTGAAVVTAPFAGPLIDRLDARTVAAVSGVALAIGYGALAFVASPAPAFAAAALAGAGNGALAPSQVTLLAALAPPDARHRVTAVSRVAANAGFGLGGAIGGAVAASGAFVALFLANGVTCLLYVLVLVVAVRVPVGVAAARAGGYRVVLRDRAFTRLAAINVALIAVGWGVFPWVIPPYAISLGVSEQLIGLLLLANAVTVVVVQVPIARLAEGRRRVLMMALAAGVFAAACLMVLLGPAALLAAAVAFGVGECLYSAVLHPLVADLAPVWLRGRYMAAIGLSWWIGLALAPTLGTQVPAAVALVAAAGVAAAAGAFSLRLRLPEHARVTPRPREHAVPKKR